MPIYEFTCEDCSTDSEQLVRSSDWKNHTECPHCGSVKLEKKLSVFSAGASGAESTDLPSCSGVPSNCGRCSLDN